MEVIAEQKGNGIEMAKKRIYNPVTQKYYAVRSKTTKAGKPGQIKGLWSSKPKTSKTKKRK